MTLSINNKMCLGIFYLLLTYTTAAQNVTQISNIVFFNRAVTFNNIYSNKEEFLTTYAGEHYFVTENSPNGSISRELYKTDGITSTRVPLPSNVPISKLVGVFQNKLYFLSQSQSSTSFTAKLYSFDGTTAIPTPALVFSETDVKFLQNQLVFWGTNIDTTNNTYTSGLIHYDGNTLSTVRSFNTQNNHLTVDTSTNTLYFGGNKYFSSTHYLGTYQNNIITHLDSSNYPSYDHQLFQNELYFIAPGTTSNGYSIVHHYDGTTVAPLTNSGGTPYFNTSSLTDKNGVLYFLADPTPNASYRKAYQHVNNQVTLLNNKNYDFFMGLTSGGDWIETYNNSLFFGGIDSIQNQSELHRKNATNTTTFDLSVAGNSAPSNFWVYNNRLYFTADSSSSTNDDRELWQYDGNSFQKVADLYANSSSNPGNFQLIDGEFYFTATVARSNTANFLQLFKLSTLPHTINIDKLASQQDLKVFPNPTIGQITLQTIALIETVQILNLEGKVVLTPSVDNINISSLPTGIYILYAKTNEGSMYQKVVKK